MECSILEKIVYNIQYTYAIELNAEEFRAVDAVNPGEGDGEGNHVISLSIILLNS